ncbi:DMT family transporter [Jatrophihabitans telluris]|uniref:DMT family transporter n=1 Tax=Jatrophihabitans telluris TaxID=2038343 RepID=A0ABY4QY62_9ACTN|nr:DMT family transporter [Jatrophihabitans telluris]UQX88448.1 DMT family transporter [Jatrophihabitans telluris]
MSNSGLVIALSLLSALAFAISTNLKHNSAATGPALHSMSPKNLGGFVLATVNHPLWLAGIAADLIGLVLQIVALHRGALAVVQLLLVSGLLFTLIIRNLHHRRIDHAELGWALLLVLTLGGFLYVAAAAPTSDVKEGVDRLPAALAALAGTVVAVGAVLLARRVRPAATGAAALGIAVGIIYASDAALLKACSDRLSRGLGTLLTSWQLPTVIVVGALGLFLCQLAYQAGPLSASQPSIVAVDPLVSVVIGVLIFDEHLRRGPWTGAALAVLVVLLTLAVVNLARLESRQDAPDSGAVAARTTGG